MSALSRWRSIILRPPRPGSLRKPNLRKPLILSADYRRFTQIGKSSRSLLGLSRDFPSKSVEICDNLRIKNSLRFNQRFLSLALAFSFRAALAFLPRPAAADGVVYKDIQIDKVARTVTFPAEINMASGMLEYLIVNNKGKTHESLLSTATEPYDLQVAMLLLGIKPAHSSSSEPPGQLTREYLRAAPELKGEKVSITLSWPGHRMPAEDLIWNLDQNAAMTAGPWIYNGSEMYDGQFLAQVDGSITALVRDSAALMNNPRPGDDDDQIWEVDSGKTPPKGTAVDVTLKLLDNSMP